MARKRQTAEEITGKLRAVEVELAKAQSAQQACRKIGVTEQTCWPRDSRRANRPTRATSAGCGWR